MRQTIMWEQLFPISAAIPFSSSKEWSSITFSDYFYFSNNGEAAANNNAGAAANNGAGAANNLTGSFKIFKVCYCIGAAAAF